MGVMEQVFPTSMWAILSVGVGVVVLAVLLRLLFSVLAARKREFGYIYVISNRASFGPDVWKIGMTRKSNPHDRIRRGNTYVPFDFVANALVESKDVVRDEKRIHRALRRHRMNSARPQREFFRAPFSVVVDAVNEAMPKAKWLCCDEDPEQRDYVATTQRTRRSAAAP